MLWTPKIKGTCFAHVFQTWLNIQPYFQAKQQDDNLIVADAIAHRLRWRQNHAGIEKQKSASSESWVKIKLKTVY